jgi:hypothetical protein
MDTVILSDEDCDGLCAAKIISSAYPTSCAVLFQKWNIFGLVEGDVKTILSNNPKEVYLLDLGSGMEMLQAASDILGTGAKVTILDNHPPDTNVETQKAMGEFNTALARMRGTFGDKFYYDSSTETCTTGIAYEMMSQRVPIDIRWALIGLVGDVATDPKKDPRGYALYSHLLEVSPYLNGLFMAKGDGASYDFGLLNFFAKLLHVPRRMVFDEAPALAFGAMAEMEKMPNWIEFNRLLGMKDPKDAIAKSPLFKDDKNSNLKVVLTLQAEWEKEHGKAENKGESTLLHYPDFDVTILSHKWNLGSALASKRLGIGQGIGKPKAQFVINDIPGQEIHISGRGPTELSVPATNGSGATVAGVYRTVPGLHIGKVFRRADPTIMFGGGIQPAGSAKGMVNDPEVLLNELVKAVAKAKA